MSLRGEPGESQFEAGSGCGSGGGGRWKTAGSAYTGAEDHRRRSEVPGGVAAEQDQNSGADGRRKGGFRQNESARDRRADAGGSSAQRGKTERRSRNRNPPHGGERDQGAVQFSRRIFGADWD